MPDRHDPMVTYAMTALAANKRAGIAQARTTFGRMQVEPNATNASLPVNRLARRSGRRRTGLDELVEGSAARPATGQRDGTPFELRAESMNAEGGLRLLLRERLAAAARFAAGPVHPGRA